MWEQWLRCKIVKGMFSDELAVCFRPRGAIDSTSVFVPKESVRGDVDHDGTVKVKVFRQGDTSWVVLPSDQQLVVPVDDSDLVTA